MDRPKVTENISNFFERTLFDNFRSRTQFNKLEIEWRFSLNIQRYIAGFDSFPNKSTVGNDMINANIYRDFIQYLKTNNYAPIATTVKLMGRNIFYRDDRNNHYTEENLLQSHNLAAGGTISVVRIYSSGRIGSGLPCQRCLNQLKDLNVAFSLGDNSYRFVGSSTYTTNGEKYLDSENMMYEKIPVICRFRED